jgi:hypothetical protein
MSYQWIPITLYFWLAQNLKAFFITSTMKKPQSLVLPPKMDSSGDFHQEIKMKLNGIN